MCGICGQYNFGTGAPVRRHTVEAMTRTLAHRGPDDEGYYIAGPVGLGFRRLAIIDLAGGHQPMSDTEKSVWVVFNGEIYNFRELRQELEANGHVFQTNSDTEVIVHGYKQWGDHVLTHLNGMFGLAVWDAHQRRLLLARDPFGIKLLYYHINGECLYFGSEIRALQTAMPESAEIDATSLNLFLRYRFTPSPYCLIKGIKKLAPGTKLVAQDGTYQLSRWYTFRPAPCESTKTPAEAREALLELYKRAVRRQLVSDVPVGLLLSGGIDSAMLLGLMNLNGKPWPTYSVGYGADFADDELIDAAETAHMLQSKHTGITITKQQFEKALPKIVDSVEEPIAASSIVPMYFVCERARRDVKVALVGQGPDELFGGYRRHFGLRYGATWARVPGWLRRPISAAILALPRNETLKRGVYSLAIDDRMRRYQHVLSLMAPDDINGLFRDGLLGPGSGDAILECWADMAELASATDDLGGLQFLELRSTLPDELLMYADKLSMAHGLELRVPYLDKDIVEYVESLPADFKVRNGSGKWLHRQVCRTYLPDPILKRPKRGFAVNVVDDWFRAAVGNGMSQLLLDSSSMMYQYLRPDVVHRLLQEHCAGRNDNHKVLFSLVVFEQWLRNHEVRVAAVN